MSALIGHIAAFLSNLFFGLSIPVTKELLSSWLDPIGYTLLRALSAAVIFWNESSSLPPAGLMRSYYGKKICPFQNMQHLPNSVWRFVRHIIRRCG
jgi:hypothetical protein